MAIETSQPVKIVTASLAALAAGLSALLFYQSQTQQVLPGCGGESGCGAVLASKWAYWFGIPVSLPALLLYTAMLVAVVMRDPKGKNNSKAFVFTITLCAIAVMLSAGWFLSIQVLVIKSLCKYCLATHAAGVAAAVLGLAVASVKLDTKGLSLASVGGLVLVCVLVGGQIAGAEPEAAAPQVQFVAEPSSLPQMNTPADPLAVSPPLTDPLFASAPEPTTPTSMVKRERAVAVDTVSLFAGKVEFDSSRLPFQGDPDADRVMVCLFDYTCSHCRETRAMLDKLQQKSPDAVTVVFVPVPLDTKCNHLIKKRNYANRYACDMAELSLAFWKVAPEKWAKFDKMLYTNEDMLTPVRARIAAEKLVDKKKLKAAMQEQWITDQIRHDVQLYAKASRLAKSGLLPMMITRVGVMNGTPRHPLDLEDFIKGVSPK